MPLVFIPKTGNSNLSKPEGTLEQETDLFCTCRYASKFLLENYSGNDFRQLTSLSSKEKLIVYVLIYSFM